MRGLAHVKIGRASHGNGGGPPTQAMAVVSDDMEMEKADAEWAEALALRILLAGVQPERRAEAVERVRSLVRDFEAPRPAGTRRLPRMSGTSRRRVRSLR